MKRAGLCPRRVPPYMGTAADMRTYRYNDYSDVTAIISAGNQVDRTYDAAGQMVTDTVTGRGTTRYGYDVAGRIVSLTDPLGRRRTNTDDLAGRLTGESAYDAAGTLVGSTSYGLDKAGNVTSMTEPRG